LQLVDGKPNSLPVLEIALEETVALFSGGCFLRGIEAGLGDGIGKRCPEVLILSKACPPKEVYDQVTPFLQALRYSGGREVVMVRGATCCGCALQDAYGRNAGDRKRADLNGVGLVPAKQLQVPAIRVEGRAKAHMAPRRR